MGDGEKNLQDALKACDEASELFRRIIAAAEATKKQSPQYSNSMDVLIKEYRKGMKALADRRSELEKNIQEHITPESIWMDVWGEFLAASDFTGMTGINLSGIDLREETLKPRSINLEQLIVENNLSLKGANLEDTGLSAEEISCLILSKWNNVKKIWVDSVKAVITETEKTIGALSRKKIGESDELRKLQKKSKTLRQVIPALKEFNPEDKRTFRAALVALGIAKKNGVEIRKEFLNFWLLDFTALDLQGSNLEGVTLPRDLSGCNLLHTNLAGVDLVDVTLDKRFVETQWVWIKEIQTHIRKMEKANEKVGLVRSPKQDEQLKLRKEKIIVLKEVIKALEMYGDKTKGKTYLILGKAIGSDLFKRKHKLSWPDPMKTKLETYHRMLEPHAPRARGRLGKTKS